MVDVRELLIHIDATDDASNVMDAVEQLRSTINGSTAEINISATGFSAAQQAYDDVAKAMSTPIQAAVQFDTSTVNTAINDTLRSSNLLGGSMTAITSGVTQATSASEKLKGVWAAVSEAGSGVKNTMNGITDSINSATLAIGAIVAMGANQAFKAVELDDAIKEQFKNDDYMKVEEYIGNKPKYISEDEIQGSLLKNKIRGIGLDESLRMIDVVSKAQFSNAASWSARGQTVESTMSSINAMSNLYRNQIVTGKDIKGREANRLASIGIDKISKEDIDTAYTELRSEGKATNRQKDFDKIWRRVIENAYKKQTGEIDWDNLSSTQRVQVMKAELEDLRDTISKKVVPVLVNFIDTITRIIEVINAIPGATTFVAYATIFGTIALVAARLAGAFNAIQIAISGATAAMKTYQAVALGTENFSGAKAALNAPLRRVGNFAKSTGIATSGSGLGILDSMRDAYKPGSVAASAASKSAGDAARKAGASMLEEVAANENAKVLIARRTAQAEVSAAVKKAMEISAVDSAAAAKMVATAQMTATAKIAAAEEAAAAQMVAAQASAAEQVALAETTASANVMAASTGATKSVGMFAALRAGAVSAMTAIRASIISLGKAIWANPYLAIAALAILFVMLLAKMGYLTRAWNAFANSNFGKDVIYAFYRIQVLIGRAFVYLDMLWERMSGPVGGAIVSVFETIASIIGGVYNTFDAIYTKLKESGKLKLALAPLAIGAALPIIAPLIAVFSPLLGIIAPVAGVLIVLGLVYKILKEVYPYLKWAFGKLIGVLQWLWDTLKGLWNWLLKAIPGAEKRMAKEKLDQAMTKEGIYLTDDGKWGRRLNPGEEGYTDMNKGILPANNMFFRGATPSDKVLGLKKTYDDLPGFAEEIANAIIKGLAGALKAALDGIFGEGTFDAIVQKLTDLINKIDSIFGGGSDAAKSNEAATNAMGNFDTFKEVSPGQWEGEIPPELQDFANIMNASNAMQIHSALEGAQSIVNSGKELSPEVVAALAKAGITLKAAPKAASGGTNYQSRTVIRSRGRTNRTSKNCRVIYIN